MSLRNTFRQRVGLATPRRTDHEESKSLAAADLVDKLALIRGEFILRSADTHAGALGVSESSIRRSSQLRVIASVSYSSALIGRRKWKRSFRIAATGAKRVLTRS